MSGDKECGCKLILDDKIFNLEQQNVASKCSNERCLFSLTSQDITRLVIRWAKFRMKKKMVK